MNDNQLAKALLGKYATMGDVARYRLICCLVTGVEELEHYSDGNIKQDDEYYAWVGLITTWMSK